jgi:hypothetical protein
VLLSARNPSGKVMLVAHSRSGTVVVDTEFAGRKKSQLGIGKVRLR